MRLRYAGSCIRCGAPLAAGVEAIYDRASRTVRCIECPAEAGEAVEAADAPAVPPAVPPAELPAELPAINPGVAGASAQREFERRKGKREARIKDRFGDRVGGWITALTDEPQSTRAWARGARGERELADALAGVDGIQLLHDRRVPGTRGNIDHLVVAPAGVFVVDAKRYQGLIEIRDVGGLFRTDKRLYVGRRDCTKLADAMGWQVTAVQGALQTAWSAALPPITPVLCFVDARWPIFRPPDSYGGVRLESERSIRRLLMAQELLDGSSIEALARILAAAFPPK